MNEFKCLKHYFKKLSRLLDIRLLLSLILQGHSWIIHAYTMFRKPDISQIVTPNESFSAKLHYIYGSCLQRPQNSEL